MNINQLFDPVLLQAMLVGGYVSTTEHPSETLRIYNYSALAQYERVWNDVTLQSRGLIVEIATGEIVARPFAKFFNYAEFVQEGIPMPEGDPLVTEKMDGSLGIIYTYEGQSYVATRGSFASDQALWATEHLRKHYPNFGQPEGTTTLVEIIYPQNRIVVDYGSEEGLWLLGAINNETGADIAPSHIDWWDGPRAMMYGWLSLDDSVALGTTSFEEGVVLTWFSKNAPSFRLKVKSPRYVELHRIVTNLSTRSVWEALATGTFDQLLEVVPDEFHPWIKGVEADLSRQYEGIYASATDRLNIAREHARGVDHTYSRAELAAEITKDTQFSGLAFALEDGKDIAPRIWQLIKPERSMAMIVEEV